MNKTTLWLLLVTAGAAFGMGYVMGPGTLTSESVDLTMEDTTQDVRDVASTKTLMSGSQGPSLAAAASPSLQSSLEAVLDALPTPTRESGDGTITGQVVTEAGEPLAGVRFVATPWRRNRAHLAPPSGPEFESLPLEERMQRRVRQLVETARWNDINKTEATSGVDGSFTLADIGDLAHKVRPLLKGWTIKSKHGTSQVKSGERLQFVATRVTGLRLEVFGPDGKAPDSARVTFQTGSNPRRIPRMQGGSWTPAQPLVEATPGHYQLVVVAGDHGELRGGPIDVEIDKVDPVPIRVDLTLVPVVLIEVAHPKGEEMRGDLYVLKTDGPAEPTGAELKGRGKHFYRFRSMGSTQVVEDLKEGWYAFGFSRGGSFDAIKTLQVKPGVSAHTLTVPPAARDRYVVLRLSRPNGRPFVGADITSGYESSSGSRRVRPMFSDRGNGEYLVMQDTRAPKDSGATYWIEASSTALGEARATYRKVEGQTLEVSFETPSQVHFTVKGDSGKRPVFIEVGRSTRSLGNPHQCDVDGKVIVQPIQPGKYVVAISVGGGFSTAVAFETVTIRPGANNIALALPTLYSIRVRGGEGRVTVSLNRDASNPHRAVRRFYRSAKSVDGEAVIDGIPAGEYKAYFAGEGTATFTLPGTASVTLEEKRE